MKKLAVALLMAVCLVKAAHGPTTTNGPISSRRRTGHPYWNAAYAGFDYAARKFGVEQSGRLESAGSGRGGRAVHCRPP